MLVLVSCHIYPSFLYQVFLVALALGHGPSGGEVEIHSLELESTTDIAYRDMNKRVVSHSEALLFSFPFVFVFCQELKNG